MAEGKELMDLSKLAKWRRHLTGTLLFGPQMLTSIHVSVCICTQSYFTTSICLGEL